MIDHSLSNLSTLDLYERSLVLLSSEDGAGDWHTAATRVAQQLSVVTDKKVRLARVREQVASTRSTVERLGRSHDELVGRISKLEDELTQISRQSGETSEQLVQTKESLTVAALLAQTTQETLSEARRLFDDARQALGEGEAGLKTLRTAVNEASERLKSQELTLERLSINREHLLASVREKFRGLDLRRCGSGGSFIGH